jgi:selenocysteine-specific elongation factor
LHTALENRDELALSEILLRRAGVVGLTLAQLRLELRRADVSALVRALEKRKLLWRAANSESSDEILLHQEIAASIQEATLQILAAFHQKEPLAPALPREALRAGLPASLSPGAFDALLLQMNQAQSIAVEPAGARLASHRVLLSEDEARLKKHLLQRAHEAAWQAFTLDELVEECRPAERTDAKKLCFALIKEGALVRAGDFVLTRERLEEGAQILKKHLQQNSTLSIGEARELLNTTRKWLVPLLEHYDRIGLTRRAGEGRVLR